VTKRAKQLWTVTINNSQYPLYPAGPQNLILAFTTLYMVLCVPMSLHSSSPFLPAEPSYSQAPPLSTRLLMTASIPISAVNPSPLSHYELPATITGNHEFQDC
jgi:hypothetical protein